MSRRRKKSSEDAALGCVAYCIVGMFFMPLLGLYFLLKGDPQKQPLGVLLLILGLVLWAIVLL